MKHSLRWLLLISLLFANIVSAQQMLFPTSVNAGNPNGLRTLGDASSSGTTTIMTYNFGTAAINMWSPSVQLPFTFQLDGQSFNYLIASKNGLISFDTTNANTAVNTALNVNSSLPNVNLPNNTIAYFWDNFSTLSSGDNIYAYTVGTAPNRQFWVFNFSYTLSTSTFSYIATVLEEGTNKIYVVDMYGSGQAGMSSTVGYQVNSTTAFQATQGLYNANGSPSISLGNLSSTVADNSYYTFLYVPAGGCAPVTYPSGIAFANAVGLNWTVNTSGSSTNIEWGPTGFSPGTGSSITVTGDTAYITGLDPLTSYDFYLTADCGGGSSSIVMGPYTYQTTCPVAFVAPFYASFDQLATGSASSGSFANCWTTDATSTSVYRWVSQISSGTDNNTSGTGPAYDKTTEGVSGGTYMFVESSSGAIGDQVSLISPLVDVSGLSTPTIKFWYHRFGSSMGDMSVDVYNGTTWVNNVAVYTGQSQSSANASWKVAYVPLTMTLGDTIQFRFRATRGSDGLGDMAIDEVRVMDASACPEIGGISTANLTSSAVDVSWLSFGSSFNVEWGPSGFTPGTGMTQTGLSATTAAITGLNSATYYDIYVSSPCSNINYGPITIFTPCSSQLSGTYYINGTTSSNSFVDLNEAINVLTQCGISGPTTIEFTAGTKKVDFALKQPIPGADFSNRVTFRGAGTLATTLKGTGNQNTVIELDDVGYVTIENFIIQNDTATSSSYGIRVTGTSDSIIIQNNQILVSTTSTSSSCAGVVITGSATSATSASNVNYVRIANNDIVGGYYGVTITGVGTATPGVGYEVLNNTLSDQYYYGVRLYYTAYSWTIGNQIDTLRYASGYGLYMYYSDTAMVSQNRISGGNYAIYSTQSNYWNIGSSEYSNNMLVGMGGTASYGMYFSSNSNFKVYHNTVIGRRGIYFTTTSDIDIRNNIFVGNGYPAIDFNNAPTGTSIVDYNIYYRTDGGDIAEEGSSAYADLATWQLSNTSWNVNSYQGDPVFVSAYDLHVEGPLAADNGDATLGIMVDFDGETRPKAPSTGFDIGADEYIPITCTPVSTGYAVALTPSTADLEWISVGNQYNLQYGSCGFAIGSGTSIMNIHNEDTTITGLTDGSCYEFYVQNQCDTTNTWYGPYNFTTPCQNQLNGVYTISSTPGTNVFSSLDDAAHALRTCGITGSVTIQIPAGLHIADLEFNLPISGLSNANTITFEGAGKGTSIVYPSNGNTAVFGLNGNGHITIKDMTIKNDSITTNAVGVRIQGDADSVIINNCEFLMNPTVTSSTNASVAVTNSATSVTSTGGTADYITITNCDINGGYYGISLNGTSSSNYVHHYTVENNAISNTYSYALRLYGISTALVENNFADNFRSSTAYGLYFYYNDSLIAQENEIYGAYYGIYTLYQNVSDTSNSLIANNIVEASLYGLYMSTNVKHLGLYHNTFVGGRGFYNASNTTRFDARNNIFVGNGYPAIDMTSAAVAGQNMDYNLLYRIDAGTLAEEGSGAYADLTAWQTANTSLNANSVEGDPVFVGSGDYHVKGLLANNVGDNSVGILVDIDGDARPFAGSSTVDLGADEFDPAAWDASLQEVIGLSSTCGDSAIAISAVVKNFGANAITSMTLTSNITGDFNSVLTTTYSGNIAPLAVDTVLIGTINTYIGGTVNAETYVELTNDADLLNDTIHSSSVQFFPNVIEFFAPDSVCANIDSATFAAMAFPGISYGWYATALDSVPVAVGDSFAFPVAGGSQTDWYLGFLSTKDSILTTTAGGNSAGGNMFDIYAKQTVTITGFSQAVQTTGAVTAEVWYRPNSYVGNISSNSGWILLGQASIPSHPTAPALTHYPINFSVTIPAGQSYGFYVTTTSSTVSYSNGSAVGNVVAGNSFMDVLEGNGGGYFSVTNSPRIFNGQVHFSVEACNDDKELVSLPFKADPQADFSFVVGSNGAVTFDASSSTNSDTYTWNFGDGNVGSGVNSSNTYAANGSYTVELTTTGECGTSVSYDTVIVQGIGVQEWSFDGLFSVYPNPANSLLNVALNSNVDMGTVTLTLIDLTGRVISTVALNDQRLEMSQKLNVESLPAGTYVLQISSNAGQINQRVVISH